MEFHDMVQHLQCVDCFYRSGTLAKYEQSMDEGAIMLFNMKRALVVDQMLDVTLRLKLSKEGFFTGVMLMNRYLSVEDCTWDSLPLLAMTCLWVAFKTMKRCLQFGLPTMMAAFHIDKDYTMKQVLKMESKLLVALQFDIVGVTPLTILNELCYNEPLLPEVLKLCIFSQFVSELQSTSPMAIVVSATVEVYNAASMDKGEPMVNHGFLTTVLKADPNEVWKCRQILMLRYQRFLKALKTMEVGNDGGINGSDFPGMINQMNLNVDDELQKYWPSKTVDQTECTTNCDGGATALECHT